VDDLWDTKSEGVGLIVMQLVSSKISNIYDPEPLTLQMDGRHAIARLRSALCIAR